MKKPTKPGFYWAKNVYFEFEIVELRHNWDKSKLEIFEINNEMKYDFEDGTHVNFIGPIDPPKTNGTRKYCANCIYKVDGSFFSYCKNLDSPNYQYRKGIDKRIHGLDTCKLFEDKAK